jgi:hypothetical protein
MNTEIEIKSRKYLGAPEKYEDFSGDRLGYLEQLSC